MGDRLEKPGSTLALAVEKKPQRPGGCVGIFFQLFDWNRRLAKKKLFTKKLLPPDRLKQSSKKFGGDEKQAKIRLIADENKGGFPSNVSSNSSNADTRIPGLVARLMGLETMPATHRDKSKKVSKMSGTRSGKGEKFIDCAREETSVEKEGGSVKHELRPPKLQRTTGSASESQAVARFGGAEKLPLVPFKNVLSKTRKHHHGNHLKLPTPVKSPKSGSRKGSSRLIGAATRILEPGLQNSRSKSALTYSTPMDRSTRNADMENGARTFANSLEDCEGANGQQCRNCGYLLGNSDCKPIEPMVFVSPVSHCVGSTCQGSEISGPGCSSFSQELDAEPSMGYPAIEINNVRPHVKFTSYKNPLSDQVHPLKEQPVTFGSIRKPQNDNQMVHLRDDTNRMKSFISMNSPTRMRAPVRKDNGKFEPERRVANRLNDLGPPGRKRRPTNVSRHGEGSSFNGSPLGDQNRRFSQSMLRKHPGCDDLINRQRSRKMRENAVSYAYNSQVKITNETHEISGKRVKKDVRVDNKRESATNEHGRKQLQGNPMVMSGDALGAFLQQKLKELSCQGDEMGGNVPTKTTAMVLHELISALSSELPSQQDHIPAPSDHRNSWPDHCCSPYSASLSISQATAVATKFYVDQHPDNEHLSPGSVLEAYFSTESCPSSISADDCRGYKTLVESAECSQHRQQSPNTEPLNFVASLKMLKNSNEFALDILNSVSETLHCSKLANCRLDNDINLNQAKEVLSTAELVLHDAGGAFLIKHLFVDEIEVLGSVLWMNFGCNVGIEDRKVSNKLTRFAFDAAVEHLASRFRGYLKPIPKVEGKLPLHINANTLIFEIVEAVGKWEEMSRWSLDEVIEREMGCSLGEWTECEAEVMEMSVEVSRCLWWDLVDEVARELLKWRLM